VKPLGIHNEHPNTSEPLTGQQHAASLVQAVRASPLWSRTLIVITYDENGGRWDHVAPPVVDRWGPGVRVPAVIVSPLVKRGHVDHTPYDTTAILKLIQVRWGVAPLGARDAAQLPLTGAF
jgi:acid phosphatase